jgi:membrane-associated phospholipid phosphatase
MSFLVVAVAQYALFVVALGACVVWLQLPRGDRLALAVQTLVTVVAVAVLVKVAGAVHSDPRPFVVHPGLAPLFPHPADNGFPSDHTALASAVAFLVIVRRRTWGALLLMLSLALGAARVAAHVHHVEDIACGLVIGALAAAVGWAAWRALSAGRARIGSAHRQSRDPDVAASTRSGGASDQ